MIITQGLKSAKLITQGYSFTIRQLIPYKRLRIDFSRQILQMLFSRDKLKMDFSRKLLQADFSRKRLRMAMRKILQFLEGN